MVGMRAQAEVWNTRQKSGSHLKPDSKESETDHMNEIKFIVIFQSIKEANLAVPRHVDQYYIQWKKDEYWGWTRQSKGWKNDDYLTNLSITVKLNSK